MANMFYHPSKSRRLITVAFWSSETYVMTNVCVGTIPSTELTM